MKKENPTVNPAREPKSLREPIVELRRVEKTYDGVSNAIESLDLTIERGEFLTLLGPSGSGKTSTLMMIAGFETPTAGDILVRGKSMKNIPPYKRNMGIVFQSYALFPHLNVQQNIAYPLARRGIPKKDASARVSLALELVQLSGLGKRRPSDLSGGQQQRVALARALVFEPEVVLLDEPLGALDKKLREHMQIELKRLHSILGITFVYVTHDQGEALTMSDRIAVFNQGRIEQIGKPSEIYEHPANLFVANFVGDNNTVDAVICEGANGKYTAMTATGVSLTATAATYLANGTAVRISVRPERVAIGLASRTCANRMSGEVIEMIYYGDHFRLRLRVGENENFIILVQVSSVDRAPEVGESVEIGWDPQHSYALVGK